METIQEKFFISDRAYELLDILKKSKSWYLPAELSTKMKLRREALFELVDELDKVGYGLEFHPYFGFRLIDLPNSFIPGEIISNLNINVLNKGLHVLKDSHSAMRSAIEMLSKGEADEGSVLLADEQSDIKAWGGHDWFSTGDYGICLAVVMKLPSLEVDKKLYLNLVGTLSTAYTLTDNVHIPAKILMPSGIYVYDKKIANILVGQHPEMPEYFVLGININVNMDRETIPEEFADHATSVMIERGSSMNRNEILRYLLFNLDNLLNKLRKRKYRPLETLWQDYCALKPREKGQEVSVNVKTADSEIEGTVISSDPIKGLTIKTSDEEKLIPVMDLQKITIIK